MQNFFNSKFYEVLCFIYKVLVLNIIFVISLIPIITVIPAIISLFKVCRKYLFEQSNEIYSVYFQSYFKDFWRNCLVSIIFLGILSLLGYSLFSFYTLLDFNKLYYIGLAIVGVFMVLYILGFIHYPLIKTYFKNLNMLDEIKLSFRFLFKFRKRSLLIVILIIINVFILYWIPILSIFIGFAPVVLLIVKNLDNLYCILVEKYNLE